MLVEKVLNAERFPATGLRAGKVHMEWKIVPIRNAAGEVGRYLAIQTESNLDTSR